MASGEKPQESQSYIFGRSDYYSGDVALQTLKSFLEGVQVKRVASEHLFLSQQVQKIGLSIECFLTLMIKQEVTITNRAGSTDHLTFGLGRLSLCGCQALGREEFKDRSDGDCSYPHATSILTAFDFFNLDTAAPTP